MYYDDLSIDAPVEDGIQNEVLYFDQNIDGDAPIHCTHIIHDDLHVEVCNCPDAEYIYYHLPQAGVCNISDCDEEHESVGIVQIEALRWKINVNADVESVLWEPVFVVHNAPAV